MVVDGDLYAALTRGQLVELRARPPTSTTSRDPATPTPGWPTCWPTSPTPRPTAARRVNGVDTVRVTGNVSADAVNKIAPQIGATGPVPGTAWIAEDGDHELVQAKLEPTPGNSVTMTLSDWGKPVTVTKPAV